MCMVGIHAAWRAWTWTLLSVVLTSLGIGGQLAQLFGWIGSLQVSRWWLRSSVGGSVCVHKSWDEPSHIRNAGLALLHLYRASKVRGYIPLVHTG